MDYTGDVSDDTKQCTIKVVNKDDKSELICERPTDKNTAYMTDIKQN